VRRANGIEIAVNYTPVVIFGGMAKGTLEGAR